MTKGRAYGKDRGYQIQCRDVIVHRNHELVPYSGDGIDVPLDVGGTTWTIDVVLKDDKSDLVVAECRRRKANVKQAEVAAFAYIVEKLREDLGFAVAGFFFTKSSHQLGSLKVADLEGISMIVLSEGEEPPSFVMKFQEYDPDRAGRLNHYVLHAEPGRYRISGV